MAFPGLCRKLVCLSPFAGSRQASAFPILNVGWIPTQHPQKSGSSLSPENSPFQITARPYGPSAPVSVARAGDQGPGWGGGQADAVGQLRRLTEVQGRGDELGAGGGSHTVNAGPAGGAQGRGEGRPLTLDLGAPRLTISPLLSAESLCPHRWLSGRCSGPGNTGRCSGLDSPLPTPADGVANQPTALSVAGSPSALPRRCGLHPSQSCRHPGRAGDGEQSVSCPHPIRNLARLGRAGETGLG